MTSYIELMGRVMVAKALPEIISLEELVNPALDIEM